MEIGFKCAMALAYVYRQGLIHRDVKPANILTVLRNEQVVDVEDRRFRQRDEPACRAHAGLSRRLAGLHAARAARRRHSSIAAPDIYALAGVLYHLIAGRAPFDATQQAALMHQIYHAAPASLRLQRDGVPQRLDALILRALSKQRDDRHADWESFAQELAALVAEGDVPRGPLQGVLDSERFNLLRALEFFAGFGDVELWEVVHRAQWQRCAFGHALYKHGEPGNTFHIIAQGQVEVFRDGRRVAQLGAGTSVGEMAYLAPSPDLRIHSADVIVAEPATTISFTPQMLESLSLGTRRLFDAAFIRVLVRRLHAAHEQLAHPRRIL